MMFDWVMVGCFLTLVGICVFCISSALDHRD